MPSKTWNVYKKSYCSQSPIIASIKTTNASSSKTSNISNSTLTLSSGDSTLTLP
jgi:hypothetical protein